MDLSDFPAKHCLPSTACQAGVRGELVVAAKRNRHRRHRLAPQVVERIAALLHNIAERGISILLVEQKLTIALRISHRLYVMGHGRVVFEGTPDELRRNDGVRKEWLEV